MLADACLIVVGMTDWVRRTAQRRQYCLFYLHPRQKIGISPNPKRDGVHNDIWVFRNPNLDKQVYGLTRSLSCKNPLHETGPSSRFDPVKR